jgi:hypothetical protein
MFLDGWVEAQFLKVVVISPHIYRTSLFGFVSPNRFAIREYHISAGEELDKR